MGQAAFPFLWKTWSLPGIVNVYATLDRKGRKGTTLIHYPLYGNIWITRHAVERITSSTRSLVSFKAIWRRCVDDALCPLPLRVLWVGVLSVAVLSAVVLYLAYSTGMAMGESFLRANGWAILISVSTASFALISFVLVCRYLRNLVSEARLAWLVRRRSYLLKVDELRNPQGRPLLAFATDGLSLLGAVDIALLAEAARNVSGLLQSALSRKLLLTQGNHGSITGEIDNNGFARDTAESLEEKYLESWKCGDAYFAAPAGGQTDKLLAETKRLIQERKGYRAFESDPPVVLQYSSVLELIEKVAAVERVIQKAGTGEPLSLPRGFELMVEPPRRRSLAWLQLLAVVLSLLAVWGAWPLLWPSAAPRYTFSEGGGIRRDPIHQHDEPYATLQPPLAGRCASSFVASLRSSYWANRDVLLNLACGGTIDLIPPDRKQEQNYDLAHDEDSCLTVYRLRSLAGILPLPAVPVYRKTIGQLEGEFHQATTGGECNPSN